MRKREEKLLVKTKSGVREGSSSGIKPRICIKHNICTVILTPLCSVPLAATTGQGQGQTCLRLIFARPPPVPAPFRTAPRQRAAGPRTAPELPGRPRAEVMTLSLLGAAPCGPPPLPACAHPAAPRPSHRRQPPPPGSAPGPRPVPAAPPAVPGRCPQLPFPAPRRFTTAGGGFAAGPGAVRRAGALREQSPAVARVRSGRPW